MSVRRLCSKVVHLLSLRAKDMARVRIYPLQVLPHHHDLILELLVIRTSKLCNLQLALHLRVLMRRIVVFRLERRQVLNGWMSC